MGLIKIVAVVFVVIFLPILMIIDKKHKQNYVPGNEWSYYKKLSNDGFRDGRIMMASAYIGIFIMIMAIGYAVFHAFTA